MKKLLFVLVFTFIVFNAISQVMTLRVNVPPDYVDTTFNSTTFPLFVITDSNGNETGVGVGSTASINSGALGELIMEINNIINNGYKLIHVFPGSSNTTAQAHTQTNPNSLLEYNQSSSNSGIPSVSTSTFLKTGTIFFFAVPWSSNGLEESIINITKEKKLIIFPNPANEFLDISVNYYLKGESKVVLISEAGYIYHKQSIGEILKNEKYNIDISKIPAGKYLITIINGKTYTTPQKLIVL